MQTEQINRTFSNQSNRLLALAVLGATIWTLIQPLAKAGEVRMGFIVKELTSFDVRSEGEASVYSPRKSGISIMPVLVNDSDHSVTLVTRSIKTVVRGRNVAYIWKVFSFEGALVMESPSDFGLVTLKKGQVASLEAFVLQPDEVKGAEFVVDYSIGDELRPEMDYWVGTVTGRIRFREDGTVEK